MIRAKVTRTAGRSTHITSYPADRMTVWHLRDFVGALDEAGIPNNLPVTDHRSTDTFHLTGLSVRYDETLPFDGSDGAAQRQPGGDT